MVLDSLLCLKSNQKHSIQLNLMHFWLKYYKILWNIRWLFTEVNIVLLNSIIFKYTFWNNKSPVSDTWTSWIKMWGKMFLLFWFNFLINNFNLSAINQIDCSFMKNMRADNKPGNKRVSFLKWISCTKLNKVQFILKIFIVVKKKIIKQSKTYHHSYSFR